MTIDQFVALGASFGACVSALAAFLTVREISKQRKATYRPELVPSRTPFIAKPHATAKSVLPDHWVDWPPPGLSNTGTSETTIRISNVGFGAAKQVQLHWSFDIASAIALANTHAKKSLSAAYFELQEGKLLYKTQRGEESISFWSSQKSQEFDYILPAATKLDFVQATIPHAFCQLIAALLYFSQKGDSASFPKDAPTIELAISYLDIAGTKHRTKYIMSIHVSMIVGKGESFQGYIESSRCN